MPTKQQFEAYVRVQSSGKFNMIMQASEAMVEAGLDEKTYWAIVNQYSTLKKMFEK